MTAAGPGLAGLLPELRHVLLWMANATELLYFAQQQAPVYMQGLEQGPGATGRRHIHLPALSAHGLGWAPLVPVTPRPGTVCLHAAPVLWGGWDTGPCAGLGGLRGKCGHAELRA